MVTNSVEITYPLFFLKDSEYKNWLHIDRWAKMLRNWKYNITTCFFLHYSSKQQPQKELLLLTDLLLRVLSQEHYDSTSDINTSESISLEFFKSLSVTTQAVKNPS